MTITPNTAELHAIYQFIKANPDAWDQAYWGWKSACGTAYCFAGHAAIRSGAKPLWVHESLGVRFRDVEINGELSPVSEYAQEILGLTTAQAFGLFKGDNALEDIRARITVITGVDPDAEPEPVIAPQMAEPTAVWTMVTLLRDTADKLATMTPVEAGVIAPISLRIELRTGVWTDGPAVVAAVDAVASVLGVADTIRWTRAGQAEDGGRYGSPTNYNSGVQVFGYCPAPARVLAELWDEAHQLKRQLDANDSYAERGDSDGRVLDIEQAYDGAHELAAQIVRPVLIPNVRLLTADDLGIAEFTPEQDAILTQALEAERAAATELLGDVAETMPVIVPGMPVDSRPLSPSGIRALCEAEAQPCGGVTIPRTTHAATRQGLQDRGLVAVDARTDGRYALTEAGLLVRAERTGEHPDLVDGHGDDWKWVNGAYRLAGEPAFDGFTRAEIEGRWGRCVEQAASVTA